MTVHGRTVRQRYEGRSSREFLREVKAHAGPRTMLGSGDLFTAQDCLDMLGQTGVDGVSVARGAIGNPWIFEQARALAAGVVLPPPSLHQQRDVIAEHYRLSEEIYGPEPLLPGDAEVRHQVCPAAPAVAAGARRLRGRDRAGPMAGGAWTSGTPRTCPASSRRMPPKATIHSGASPPQVGQADRRPSTGVLGLLAQPTRLRIFPTHCSTWPTIRRRRG